MKYIGIASLILGIFGFTSNVYSLYKYQQFLNNAGVFEELISIQIFSETEFQVLVLSQIIGIVFGVIGYKKGITKKVSISGALLCLLNLVLFIII